ncbi:MAG: ThuA domain-containing protein [Oscillospiraceae bacterium]|jgi:trehalose utilization protein|nr:ThuA domain-containing protein [Oscillospiraceae bacterium]
MMNVTFWYEATQEREPGENGVLRAYPQGLAAAVAEAFAGEPDVNFRAVTFHDPENGLPEEILENTDVLLWWAHVNHGDVPDDLARRVQQRVLRGMGLIVLHSGHDSKPMKLLLGTSCALKWRDDDRERLWTVLPGHPIAKGLPEYFELPLEEMYGEPFDIPTPDEVVFIGWFAGGEVFRAGCTWQRGRGRMFYFQPGHEAYPIYKDENIRQVLRNAVRWAAPSEIGPAPFCPNSPPPEAGH